MNINTVLSMKSRYGVMLLAMAFILGLIWPMAASASVTNPSPSVDSAFKVRLPIDFELTRAQEEKQPELLAKGGGRGGGRSGHGSDHSGQHHEDGEFDNHGRHGNGFDDFGFDDHGRDGFGRHDLDDLDDFGIDDH